MHKKKSAKKMRAQKKNPLRKQCTKKSAKKNNSQKKLRKK